MLLGYVSRLYKQSICVSGTHGKTTTTSMITTALELAGRDPSAVIGGKLPLINGYGKAGKGDDIVIEACEFAETFLKLTPYLSVVLNIDNDHLDYYGSMGELKFAFKRFALMTQFMIFANADDKNTMDVMYTLDRRVRTFAIDNHGDYRAVNINEYKPGFFEFDLKEWNTTDTTRIRLSVPGRHNIYNALAMCAVCRFVGLSAEQCAEAALNFKGAGRRFEVYGECNGALVIDDYAHHPTELRATLNTAKEMGYKRLIAVHQPFTYSRTKMLFNDFVDVLKIPDITVLTPIMGSREPNDPTITSAKLAAQTRLQRALINYFLDCNTKAGYLEVEPPVMVNEASGFGTGQLPDKEGQMYHATVDNFYLVPTAEVPVTNIYRDVILDESDFPVKMTAYTPCFRREAGSYGKDVRGLNRLHQFDKVEIVQLSLPDVSYEALDGMVAHVEGIVRSLGLPFRILRLCGGDMSFTSALTYDFEVYSEAQKRWLEVSSVSNFESFQANRLKLRYRDAEKKIHLAHTLNGSSLALPRIVAALLENYQTPEGIRIPEVLIPYTGFDIIK